MSLGELHGVGYNTYAWRQREKEVEVHVVPEAEARHAPPHPDGIRGAKADGAVIAVPADGEVAGHPTQTQVAPHSPFAMLHGVDSGMGMGVGAGIRMTRHDMALQQLIAAHLGIDLGMAGGGLQGVGMAGGGRGMMGHGHGYARGVPSQGGPPLVPSVIFIR